MITVADEMVAVDSVLQIIDSAFFAGLSKRAFVELSKRMSARSPTSTCAIRSDFWRLLEAWFFFGDVGSCIIFRAVGLSASRVNHIRRPHRLHRIVE